MRLLLGALALALLLPANAEAATDLVAPRVAAEITLTDVWEGEFATIVWDSANADDCTLELPFGWDEPVGIGRGTSGAMQVGPIVADSVPAVECGGVRVETPVRVAPRPREGEDGVFDISCTFSHALADDPIVFPRLPGRSHFHGFLGNRTTDAFSTYDNLLQAVIDDPFATSCSEHQFFKGNDGLPARNASGYWAPLLVLNGDLFNPFRFHLYYFRGGPGQAITRAFPPGLVMVTDHMAGRFKYWCKAPGNFAKDRMPDECFANGDDRCPKDDEDPPRLRCQASAAVTAEIRFPHCWDGRLDSPDHKSHVAFPDPEDEGGGCPASHPKLLPRLLMELKYAFCESGNPCRRFRRDDVWSLTSGPLDSMHADVFSVWDPFRLDQLVHVCSNTGAGCKGRPPEPGSVGPIHQVKA